MATIDISALATTAIKYQKDLKMLPYAVMAETLGLMGITLFPGVQNKDVMTYFLRKQGIAKPYGSGTVVNSDLGKAEESTLTVEKAYASVKDNIQNYKKVTVGPDVLLGKNKSKKHPWQMTMLTNIIRTFGEDILDALFPAERDLADQSPLGMFDGYDTIIDAKVVAGAISAGNGNLEATGAIDKTNAFDKLLAFWRASHPLLKKDKSNLLVPYGIAEAYDDAFFDKYKQKPTLDDYGRTVIEGTAGKCKIVRAIPMGTGDRIILTKDGNLDFGMDTLSDSEFVQVRNPFEDPNDVQFWLQGDYGCRIRTVHEKVFQINDGTPVATQLSGDYIS